MSWLSRAAVRLVPAERRDWAEGLWAEAGQVPPGVARLAWRAGGVRLIVREALLVRRAGRLLVFAAAAAWVAWVAWPGPATNAATAVARLDVVTVLPVLAGLPLLVRRLLGPAALSWLARVLRVGAYAAVLVLTVAKASVEQVAYNPAVVPRLNNPDASVPALDGMIFTWLAASVFLLVVAVYVAVILVLTARRSRVAPATLAVGTGAGLALGAVMYAVMPLGLAWSATSPWLPGSAVDPVVLLAWALLFGAPVVAGSVAARCYRGPGSLEQVAKAKVRQRVAAGFLTTGIGALMVTVLGTGTVALMPRAGWLLRWLYPGQHLLAAVASNRELTASLNADNYGTILLVFPVIGLVLGFAAGYLVELPGPPPGDDSLPAVPGS
jgi:hypothetical protein